MLGGIQLISGRVYRVDAQTMLLCGDVPCHCTHPLSPTSRKCEVKEIGVGIMSFTVLALAIVYCAAGFVALVRNGGGMWAVVGGCHVAVD